MPGRAGAAMRVICLRTRSGGWTWHIRGFHHVTPEADELETENWEGEGKKIGEK